MLGLIKDGPSEIKPHSSGLSSLILLEVSSYRSPLSDLESRDTLVHLLEAVRIELVSGLYFSLR